VIDRNIFNKMFSAQDHRGPDGRNVVYLDKAALGCQYYWTTPEEADLSLPLCNKQRDCFIAFEGRLDNRDEIFKQFEFNDENISDAHIILKLFCRCNTEFFKDLLGSFVFLIYDRLKSRTTIVRDHLGDKVLYYYSDSNKFIVASEPLSILQHPGIPLEYNEKKIAEFFTLGDHTDSSSFFKKIHEIPSSHYIIYNNGDMNVHRYWDFDPNKKIRYGTDEEYAEHLKSILKKSVDCRMRTNNEAGVMMSGGYDSTSIAALASESLKNGKKLKVFSFVFDKFKESDESVYIDDFCSIHNNVESIRVNGDDCWTLNDFESLPVNPAFPYQDPFHWLKIKLFEKVRKNGIRTLLTGWFADELFAGSDYRLKDYFSDHKYLNAFTETAKLIGKTGFKDLKDCVPIRILLRPLRPVRDLIASKPLTDRQYPWLTEYSRSLLEKDFQLSGFAGDFYRRDQAILVTGLRTSLDASACAGCYQGGMLDLRLPFRDRRLAEYFFGIPSYQLYEDNDYKNKYVLKNALRKQLPESILKRNNKTALRGLLYYGLLEKNLTLVRDLIRDFNHELEPYILPDMLNNILYRDSKELSPNESYVLWSSICLITWKNRLAQTENC